MLKKHNILPMKYDMSQPTDEQEEHVNELHPGGLPIYVTHYPDGRRERWSAGELLNVNDTVAKLDEVGKAWPKAKNRSVVEACTMESEPVPDPDSAGDAALAN